MPKNKDPMNGNAGPGKLIEGSPLLAVTRRNRLRSDAHIAPILSDTDVEIAKEFAQGNERLKKNDKQ